MCHKIEQAYNCLHLVYGWILDHSMNIKENMTFNSKSEDVAASLLHRVNLNSLSYWLQLLLLVF